MPSFVIINYCCGSASISTFAAKPNDKSIRRNTLDYLFIISIMFIGACLQGITGFGSGLIAVPLLTLILPLSVITPTLSIVNFVMASYLAWMLRHALHIRHWRPLLVSGIIGTL